MTSRAPLVAITGRRHAAAILGAPSGFADAPIDLYFAEYATSVAAAGGLPVHLPLDVDPAAVLPRVDALVLAGGEDVDPARYGATPHPKLGPRSALRDDVELALVAEAHAAGTPVLGICRGHQVLNVAFGGSLVQHLDGDLGGVHLPDAAPRAARTHDVELAADSIPGARFGARLTVNSFHHQAVDRVGTGLRVVARAADGTVEAIQHDGGRMLGVQWHPETFDGDPLFAWLVEQASTATTTRGDLR